MKDIKIKPLLPKDLMHFIGGDSKHEIACYLTSMFNNLADGTTSIKAFIDQFREVDMNSIIARHFHLNVDDVVDNTDEMVEQYGLILTHKGKPIPIEWCEQGSDTVRDVGEDCFKCEIIDGKEYYWRWL